MDTELLRTYFLEFEKTRSDEKVEMWITERDFFQDEYEEFFSWLERKLFVEGKL